MLAFLNRCAFVPTAYSNTDDFEVNGSAPVTGFYAPADCLNPVVVDTATYHYFAQSADKTQHEEGRAVWDDGAGKLLRAAGTVRNSSNSGALVNFSAAPTVTMGGPVAADIVSGRWELIAETVISSPISQVEHAITNPDDYWQIMLDATGISVDADGPAVIANLLDASVTLTDTQEMLLYPNGNTNGPDHLAITVTLSANLDDGRAFSTWTFGNYSMGGTPPLNSLKAVYSGGSITELDTALHDITAGRFRTFGLRK